MEKKQRILIVDDMSTFLYALMELLGGCFDVEVASNSQEAIDVMKRVKIDALLIDQSLGSEKGDQVARELLSFSPGMAVILMTQFQELFLEDIPPVFDDLILKGNSACHWIEVVRYSIWKKQMPSGIRNYHERILGSFPDPGKIIIRTHSTYGGELGENETKKMTGLYFRDKTAASFVNYHLRVHGRGVFYIGAATSIGCAVGGCIFCDHRDDQCVRVLSENEIVAQATMSLRDNFHARGIFELPRTVKPILNLTGMGEPLLNLSNVLKALKRLASVPELGFEFIITTVGIVKMLRVLRKSYRSLLSELPLTIYLSGNSFIQSTRKLLMPGCGKENLYEALDEIERIAEITKRPNTFSDIFLPGVNDNEKEIRAGIDLLKGRPFLLMKSQPYIGTRIHPLLKSSTAKQIDDFGVEFLSAGINWRRREIAGKGNDGCGTTKLVHLDFCHDSRTEPTEILS